MKSLPRNLDTLHGLRAASWIRESTVGQYDNFGPDAQREQVAHAVERFGLVHAGIEWARLPFRPHRCINGRMAGHAGARRARLRRPRRRICQSL